MDFAAASIIIIPFIAGLVVGGGLVVWARTRDEI